MGMDGVWVSLWLGVPCTSWRDCLLRLLSLVREPKAEDEEWEGVVGRIELNIAFEHFNDSSLYLSLTCSFWLLVSRLVFRSLFSLTSNTTTCT